MTTIIRRVVTKHDKSGKPVVASDGGVPVKPWPAAKAGDAVIWSTAAVPADNSEADLAGDTRKVGTTLSGGSVFRITELGPRFMTPMHRTLSTDYCIVLSGELEVILDGGQSIKLFPGDTVVQRGTSHTWRNPSTEAPCLFLAIMIEAVPITVGGKTLGATPMWKMVASSLATMVGLCKVVQGPPAQWPASPSESVRRIVTTHDAVGKAVIASDAQVPVISWPGVDAGETVIWSTRKVPPDNSGRELDFGNLDVGPTLHGGSALRLSELGPTVTLPMHRTHSIDYCVVLAGDLELQLEGGETVTLSKGDTLVQRGTRHTWRNPSSNTPCKFVVCMIEARPLVIAGAPYRKP